MKTPIRVQRKRTKGFKLPENTVCVTRGGEFGNPFFVEKDGGFWSINCKIKRAETADIMERFYTLCDKEEDAIQTCIDAFEMYCNDYIFKYYIQVHLKGKNLACFCALDKPCHADILLKIANEL